MKNPVIFVVEVVSIIVTIRIVTDLSSSGPVAFDTAIAIGLWFTVLFANFAEAMAEGRGKAQADALRKTRADLIARRLRSDGTEETVPAAQLRAGDVVMVEAGELIPGDGDIVEGIASVDESAITGESAPVIRESGGDRSAVTAGTKVLSDWIKVKITAGPGESFLDRMISLVEGAERQKTPNEIALSILLAKFSIIFLIVCVALQPFAIYAGNRVSDAVLIALFVCLIPTTIGGLLSAIGIAGMDRLVQHNVLAMSGRAVEAAGDVSTLLLDKTGTITLGNRQAVKFFPAPGVDERELAEVAQFASLADETPEGRSIVVLAKEQYGIRERELLETRAQFVPFSANTRMSGVDLDGTEIRKGAVDAIVGGGPRHGARDERRGGAHRARRRHPVGGGEGSAAAGRDRAEGHHQGRSGGALRPAAEDGDPHRDDHRRQPAHGRGDRSGVRRRRLPRRGDARDEDGADQARAGRRRARRHDRRRHERCTRARSGRRRRGDEHRDHGGQGSRQHGRPRFPAAKLMGIIEDRETCP